MSHTTGPFHVYTVTRVATGRVVYVGMTDDPKRRWAHHCKGNSRGPLSRAVLAEGSDAFRFEVRYTTGGRARAFSVEQDMIRKHGTDDAEVGYNRKPSGGAGPGNTNATAHAVEEIAADGRVLGTYRSIKAASEATGLQRKCIAQVCDGAQRQTAGRVFRYAMEGHRK